MTPLTLTAELEQEFITNLRRVPSHQLAALINLVSSLGKPPAIVENELDEDEDDRFLVAEMRRLSQPAFERAWEEGYFLFNQSRWRDKFSIIPIGE